LDKLTKYDVTFVTRRGDSNLLPPSVATPLSFMYPQPDKTLQTERLSVGVV